MKHSIKKTLGLAATLICAFSSIAFAADASIDGGYAYLNVDHADGLKRVDAGTERNDSSDWSSLYVTTTYYNGDESTYFSGIYSDNEYYSSNWEWSEDYSSIHKISSTRTSYPYGYTVLSED